MYHAPMANAMLLHSGVLGAPVPLVLPHQNRIVSKRASFGGPRVLAPVHANIRRYRPAWGVKLDRFELLRGTVGPRVSLTGRRNSILQATIADAQVVTYGYLAQAAYDGYDHGACRYPLRRLLPALGLDGRGYVATAFLYATVNGIMVPGLEDREHRQHWIGYVAVAGNAERDRAGNAERDRAGGVRDIVVVWRGTSAPSDLFMDLEAFLEPIRGEDSPAAMVERGFQGLYADGGELSARTQALGELRRLVAFFGKEHPGDKVRVTATGHSLGGALAMLAARDAAKELSSSGGGAAAAGGSVQVRAVTFGAPRVGDAAFVDELARRGVAVRRFVVQHDVVPSIPPTYLGYADAGEVVLLDAGKEVQFAAAPFFTWIALWHFHCLKRYLGILDKDYVDKPVPPPEPELAIRDDLEKIISSDK